MRQKSLKRPLPRSMPSVDPQIKHPWYHAWVPASNSVSGCDIVKIEPCWLWISSSFVCMFVICLSSMCRYGSLLMLSVVFLLHVFIRSFICSFCMCFFVHSCHFLFLYLFSYFFMSSFGVSLAWNCVLPEREQTRLDKF